MERVILEGGFGRVLGRPGLTHRLGTGQRLWKASERTLGLTAASPRLGHSLNAGQSQLPDGALLGGVLCLSDSHSAVLPSPTEPEPAHDLWPKGGCASSRPRTEEALWLPLSSIGVLSHSVKKSGSSC